jgi:hypothetical protein
LQNSGRNEALADTGPSEKAFGFATKPIGTTAKEGRR